jgi:type IV pilus assembly protein PilM
LVRNAARWMAALAHPSLAIEITEDRLAAVRWTAQGTVGEVAIEPLPPGALLASPVEPNFIDPQAAQAALTTLCKRLQIQNEDVALLIPDSVIRVFIQHFEEFPRANREALPMLRWRLKKSVPFDIEETRISYARQAPRERGVDIVAAVARQRVVAEYAALARSVQLRAGVILSSSLAALALLGGQAATLLVRICDRTLTTAIAREGILCAYRCTELPVAIVDVTPQILLDEIFPVAAFYQDSWHEGIQSVQIAGLAERLPEFVAILEKEFHCKVEALLASTALDSVARDSVARLVAQDLEGLAGWMLNYSEDFGGVL